MTKLRDGWRLLKTTKNWYDILLCQLGLRKQPEINFRNGLRFIYVKGLFSIEHFLEEPYRCVDVKDRDVVDVGAFNGDSAVYFSRRGAKRVLALEPYPFAYRLAVKNILLNNIQNIEVYNEGLGQKDGSIILDEEYTSKAGSTLTAVRNGKKVRIRSLSTLVRDFNLKKSAVLKLDCEGCEYEVLLSVDTFTLDAFQQIILEYHHGYQQLVEQVRSLGYEITILSSSGSPIDGNPNERGLLYLRRP